MVGGALGRLAYWIAARDRRQALKNLDLVLGDKYSPAERKSIVKVMFRNLGYSIVEILNFNKIKWFIGTDGF